MSVKIGIDIRDLKIAQTGAKTYLVSLIEAWQQIPDASICLLDNNKKVYRGTNPVFKIIEHIRFIWWKQIQLPFKAKQDGCTHLFCSDFFVPFFKQGLKTIAVLHDAFFWENPEHYHVLWLQLFHIIGVPAAKKADLIIVPSEYAKNRILHFEKLDVHKMLVVHEAAKSFAPSKSQDASTNNPSATPYFLHMGVLEKRKNLPQLIKAFAQVVQKHPEYHLYLAGNTPVKKQLNDAPLIQATIQDLGLNAHVHLLGYVTDVQAAHLYEQAFAYILPSKNEGFGLPLLEAFSYGLPVICSNAGALPEIAADAALVFDLQEANSTQNLANAIVTIIENEPLRNKYAQKGIERNKAFSWHQTALQINEHIKNI